MKKIRLVALLLAAVFVTSCEKDDSSSSASILGKWYFEQTVETEYEGGVQVDKEVETDFTSADYIEFKSDGKMSEYDSSGYSGDRNYVVASGKVLISQIGSANNTTQYEIKELTATKLVLVNDETETIQGVVYRETVEVTFHR